MVNPLSVTKYDRTRDEAEEFWLYCVLVAGKNSDWASRKTEELIGDRPAGTGPFAHLASRPVRERLVSARTGQYRRITDAVADSLGVDVTAAPLGELLAVRGVGHKTARFFLLHSRRGVRVAALDTHILKWMRRLGEDAPVVTPTNPARYARVEQQCLGLMARHYPGLTPAEADLLIWKQMSGREVAA